MFRNTLLALLLMLVFVSCEAQNTDVTHVNSPDFRKLINKQNGSLLDVRTTSEFSNGHIEGSGQLNYYAMDFRQKLLLLPKNQPVYLYCNTGWRSKRAAEILVSNGYTEVYNLERGIMEWNLLDYPVIVEPGALADGENKMEPDEYAALLNSDKPVFIDFYAPWCAPCRQMMPMIDSLAIEYHEHIQIVKINADASKKLVKALKIASVPYFVLLQNSEIIFSKEGLTDRNELENVFKSYMTNNNVSSEK
ncbi:MAG: thioredoxin fold domain-containing protein [Bacteroidales bacterium]|nr:thioredoxin fold domain-containing protein [Bacteroidales bacterium]